MRRRLDTMYPQLHLEEDRQASRSAHRQRYPTLYRVRLLHHLWTTLHVAIALTGLALTITITTS
jgi:hypothetical protein